MPAPAVELGPIFCMTSKEFKIPKLLLKAVAMTESSLNPRAYRYEEGFWLKYMKDKPEWAHRDPKEVSASYGLMQVLYSTAAMFGFNGPGEDLYNPVYNIKIGAMVLRARINEVEKNNTHIRFGLWSISIALARYNGGNYKNPDEDGKLRNDEYVKKVMKYWYSLRAQEKDTCYDYD